MPVANDMTAELSELGLDRQNAAVIGRVPLTGGIAHAEERADGRMHATIRIPSHHFAWEPSVLVLPRGGDLDLDLYNDDADNHCAILPCNGDKMWIWLPTGSHGTASLDLDGPGLYWFGSTIANNEGRGLMGTIAVLGDVPDGARLDRPAQQRP